MEKTVTIGIKLARKPDNSEIKGYLVKITSKVTIQPNGVLNNKIVEQNIPFVLNRETEDVKVKMGISIEDAITLKEELKKIGYSEEVNLVFAEKIEI